MPNRTLDVTTRVLKYMNQNADRTVFVEEIMQATGLQARQIQNALLPVKLRTSHHVPIVAVVRGKAWKWDTSLKVEETKKVEETNVAPKPKKAVKRMFEELVVTKGGRLLIQDDTGAVYEATEL